MNLLFLIILQVYAKPTDELHTIKLGIAANYSFTKSSYNNPEYNPIYKAYQLAYDQNKEALKMLGLKVQATKLDYGDKHSRVLTTAKMAAEKKLDVVVGYLYSAHALIASTYLKDYGIPIILPTATSSALHRLNPNQYRISAGNLYQARILSNYIDKKSNIKKLAIISKNNCPYCLDFEAAFSKASNKEILEANITGAGLSTLDIASLKKFKPDAVLVTSHETLTARVFNHLAANGIRPKLWLGGDGWTGDQILLTKLVAPREFSAVSISHWQANADSKRSKKFVKDYTAKFKDRPTGTAGVSYESFLFLFESIIKYMKTHDKLDLKKALAANKHIEGLLGDAIMRNNDVQNKKIMLIQNINGKVTTLKTVE